MALAGTLLLLSLCAWSVQGATWTVPGVANGGGATTRVTVTNRGFSAASVTFRFLPVDSSVIVLPETRQVDAGQTLVLDDALANLWTLAEQNGALSIDGDQPLSIHARRLAGGVSGPVGSGLPVLPESSTLLKGHSGYLLWAAQTGDDATGSRSSMLLTLLDEGTRVILVVNDANGVKLGSQEFTGDAGTYVVPLSQFTQSDVAQARFTVVVAAGRAVAALETRDLASGDTAVSEATSSQELVTANVISDDVRRPASDSQTLVTDLRLANVGITKLTVPLSSPAGTRVVTLLPGQMVEILDHLGAFLGAYPNPTDAFSGLLLASADRADLVSQVRLRVVNNDGAPGALTAIHGFQPYPGGFVAGQTAIVDGLPLASGRASLILRAIPGNPPVPVQVHVQGYQGSGAASGDPVDIDLKGNEVRFVDFASIPGLANLAEGDSVSARVSTGAVDVSAFLFRAGSNDPEVWPAGVALTADDVASFNAGTPPSLASLTVDAFTLEKPGKVLIQWQSAGATFVDLAPWATGLPPSGSYEADVTATTDATVTARNACAQDDTPLHITVGTPVLTSVAGPTTSAGAPGQLLRLSLDNVSDPALVTDVLLQSEDNLTYSAPLLGKAPDGLFDARVPLIVSSTDPKGYRTGPMKLSVMIDGKPTAAMDFTIEPLVYHGDPAEGFNQLLDKFDATFSGATTKLEGLDYVAPAVPGQRAVYARLMGRLRALGANIAASGEGTLLLDPSANPGPETVTIAAADLGALLAYNDNLRPTTTDVSLEARAASSTPRDAGTCLQDKVPLIKICKAIEKFDYTEAHLTDQIGTFGDINDMGPLGQYASAKSMEEAKKFVEKLNGLAGRGKFGPIANQLSYIEQIQRIQCDLYAIRFKEFAVFPKGIHYVKAPGQNNPTPVTFTVYMQPQKSTKEFVDDLVGKESAKLRKQLKDSPLLEQFVELVLRAFEDSRRATYTNMIDAIKGYLKTDQIKPQTVGACDLKQVWGQRNGRPSAGVEAESATSIVARAANISPQGEDQYYYLGRKPNKQERMCIQVKFDNFLFMHDVEMKGKAYVESIPCRFSGFATTGGGSGRSAVSARLARSAGPATPDPDPVFFDEVNTGHGPRTFTVSAADSDTFQNNGGPEQRINAYLPDGQEVTTGKPFIGPATSEGVSSSYVNGRQTEDAPNSQSWEMNLFATGSGSVGNEGIENSWEDRTSVGFSASAVNYPQRGLSPRATIDITQNGNCGSFTYSVNILTPDGKGASLAFGPKSIMDDFHADVEASQVNLGMRVEAFDIFEKGPTSTCKPQVKLRLYDAETDNSGPVPAP